MGYQLHAKRSAFFEELPENLQKSYFNQSIKKSMHMIDNLYYTVFLVGDGKDTLPDRLEKFFEELDEFKAIAQKTREPVAFKLGLQLALKKYANSCYCLSQPELYDIFISKSLPNNDTPRIVVQLRAFGLWTRGLDSVLKESYRKLENLLSLSNCKIEKCRESRIDYCYHTNVVISPNKLFKEDSQGKVKNLYTNLIDLRHHSTSERVEDGTIFHKDYFCLGNVKSNNVRARVYDKVKEVLEMGYKSFFFQIWYDNGLISYYDKWCFEYAFLHRNVDYLYKARLAFYVAHGKVPERVNEFKALLDSEKTTLKDFKKYAVKFMPANTCILNIEYETKRKFYYYSDSFINEFKLTEERNDIAPQLERIYKILDYRQLFLDYLTSKTLSFRKGKKYLDWWQRLRTLKHDGKKVDGTLARDYSYSMDLMAVQKRTIKSLASAAVYKDNLNTGFVEDFTDLLATINDNSSYSRFRVITDEGEILENVYGSMVSEYLTEKAKKEMLLKNRKKRQAETVSESEELFLHAISSSIDTDLSDVPEEFFSTLDLEVDGDDHSDGWD